MANARLTGVVHRSFLLAAGLAAVWLPACGDAAPGSADDPGSAADGGGAPPTGQGTAKDGGAADSGGPQGDAGAAEAGQVTTLLGVWTVAGTDGTGPYTGKAELLKDGTGMRLVRVIDYDKAVTVEGGRSLSWVWEGSATSRGPGVLELDVKLRKGDFIKRRGSLQRTDADKAPAAVTGHFEASGATLVGTFTGPQIAAKETWSNLVPSGPKPIFAKDVQVIPMHDPPSDAVKNGMFLAYQSFQALPELAPYKTNPDFQRAVHALVVDKTDFDFYQRSPGALRVVDKVLDPISLQETQARADAYKWTLAGKAEYLLGDVVTKFIDPKAGMLGDSRMGGNLYPSGDGALWTATYMAAEAFRYDVTRAPDAKDHIAKSAEAILTLTEITGDPKTFARTLAPYSGTLNGGWVAGTGTFAGLQWLPGGNNDMAKGLFYGTLTAYMTLCDKGQTGYEALCARLKKGAKHVADDLEITQGSGYNRLLAQWVAHYVTGESGYAVQTGIEWAKQVAVVSAGGVTIRFEQGTADWSGTHLSFVQNIALLLLNERAPIVGVDAKAAVASGVDTIYGTFDRARMGAWSVAFAKLGKAPHPAALDDARWRLREIPAPKMQADVDHKVSGDFVMSPYPALPWKNDWTTSDRFQSLRGYPMFEANAYTVYAWKDNPLAFHNNTAVGGGQDCPGVDFLHAYWLGRRLGAFSATE